MRRSRSTSPIPPSRCPSARARSSRWATSEGNTWPQWLVDDQREASGRPDVVAFVSDVLTAPVKISGRADRQPGRLHERHRLRLGGQADRRLSRRGRRRRRRWAAISSWSRPTSSAAATARASRRPRPIAPDKPLAVPLRPADGEPRLPAGPPDHGAGPVELVPALRPQPADLRARTSSGPSRGTTARPRSGSTTRPAAAASSSCPSSPDSRGPPPSKCGEKVL